MENPKEEGERGEEHLGDLEAFALAIAGTTHRRFNADHAGWSQAIHDGREMVSDSAPDVFRDVEFKALGDGKLWSDEVDRFMSVVRRAGLMSVLSPFYKECQVEEGAKESIRREYSNVDLRLQESIAVFSRLIDERLGID